MPDIPLEPASFEFFARYVLTGFIIFVVRIGFVRAERPKIADVVLDIAMFSLLNQLVWQLVVWMGEGLHQLAHASGAAPSTIHAFFPGERVAFFLECLVLPSLIGVLSGLALARGWSRGLLRALSIPVVDPLPRAYDHVFARRGTGFVIVTYKDGTQIFGYYGEDSRAGRDPARSEIYLERLYQPQPDGP